VSQLAFTLANGFTIVEYYLARGMKIDDFAHVRFRLMIFARRCRRCMPCSTIATACIPTRMTRR
jgi:hypothetical protein